MSTAIFSQELTGDLVNFQEEGSKITVEFDDLDSIYLTLDEIETNIYVGTYFGKTGTAVFDVDYDALAEEYSADYFINEHENGSVVFTLEEAVSTSTGTFDSVLPTDTPGLASRPLITHVRLRRQGQV